MPDIASDVTDPARAGLPREHPGPLIVFIRLHARLDQIDAARHALEKITDPIRANPDCLEFRVFQDRDDPQSFTLLEHWVSREANTAHGQRDYMAEYNAVKYALFDDISGDFIDEICPQEHSRIE